METIFDMCGYDFWVLELVMEKYRERTKRSGAILFSRVFLYLLRFILFT